MSAMKELNNMKSIKYYKHAHDFIVCLNKFYDEHQNIIDECVLNDEYDLMTDILGNLMYDDYDSWYIHFKNNKYKKDIIYKANKAYWKKLSKLYKKIRRLHSALKHRQ